MAKINQSKLITNSKEIFETFKKNTFKFHGKGHVSTVAYDTAWLARIPNLHNNNLPEFPKSLEWLRQHQLPDGSWGSMKTINIFDNILSTLAALLALKQWNFNRDSSQIAKGIDSLNHQVDLLKNDQNETIGFELLLPSLLEQCQNLNIEVPKRLTEICRQHFASRTLKKKKLIDSYFKCYGFDQLAPWWFSLEILGQDNSNTIFDKINLNEKMLSKHGSVAASPSATAYLLTMLRLQRKDTKKALKYLNGIVNLHSHGVPHVYPIDEFELNFSAKYLLEAGVNIKDTYLQYLFSKIKKCWISRNKQGFGYSSEMLTDPDDTAVGICVLTALGEKNIDETTLLSFFNKQCIENFKSERNPSISANIHSLMALKALTPSKNIQNAMEKIITWLEEQLRINTVFSDKWHSSTIYPMSRAVIALEGLNNSLADRCVQWLIKQQRNDGGWGIHGKSTFEETAFASLALSYWYRHTRNLDKDVLINSLLFLTSLRNFQNEKLWLGKVLYCPFLVSSTLIGAAHYSLQNALDSSNLSQHSIKANQDRLDSISDNCKLFEPPGIKKYFEEWLINSQLQNKDSKLLKSNCIACSICTLPDMPIEELKIYTKFNLLILSLDDVLDENQNLLPNRTVIKKVFSQFLSAIEGKYKNTKQTSNNIFPQYQSFIHALQEVQKNIEKYHNASYFNKSIKKFFTALIQEYDYRYHNQDLSLNKYLKLRIVSGGMEISNELAFVLKKIKLDDNIRKSQIFKRIKSQAYNALIIANDIFSYKKEIKNNEKNNYILILKRRYDIPLDLALQVAIKHHNDFIQKFHSDKIKILRETHADNRADLKSAIDIISNQVECHLIWAKGTARYDNLS